MNCSCSAMALTMVSLVVPLATHALRSRICIEGDVSFEQSTDGEANILKGTDGKSIGKRGDSEGITPSSRACKDGESVGKCEGLRGCIGGDASA